MFRNYFMTSWRNIVKEKGYSTFNILGLAVGMAVALIIGLWVQYHLSYDRFLPHFGQAYRAMVRSSPNGVTEAHGATCLPLAEAIRRDVPEVKYVVQADWGGQHSLMTRDQKVYSQGLFAGGGRGVVSRLLESVQRVRIDCTVLNDFCHQRGIIFRVIRRRKFRELTPRLRAVPRR